MFTENCCLTLMWEEKFARLYYEREKAVHYLLTAQETFICESSSAKAFDSKNCSWFNKSSHYSVNLVLLLSGVTYNFTRASLFFLVISVTPLTRACITK